MKKFKRLMVILMIFVAALLGWGLFVYWTVYTACLAYRDVFTSSLELLLGG